MAKLQITLVRSLIGRNEKQRATVAALGSAQASPDGREGRQSGHPRHGEPCQAPGQSRRSTRL